jgi:hypothetical protein
VVAQEMVHSMIKLKGSIGYFAIKVDLSKAYDKISWEFIWRVLMEIHLPDKLVNIIMHMVTSVETNVKWNGARNEYFRPQREMSMFADDLLLFGEATEEGQMNVVKVVLDNFCKMSGQEVNIEKTSILYSKNVSRSMRLKLQQLSGVIILI